MSTYKQEAAAYADYREMLQNEKGLHAVIVATPDFLHAEQTNACLKAGLAVYCEKPMSNNLDAARSMVRTARETGKLLQIGYQRRSNPRYRHVDEVLLKKAKLTGRLTHVSGQWNQPIKDDVGWPRKFAMPEEELKRHGYADMHELRNWRAYKKYSLGRFADFGAQQVEAIQWFLGGTPKSVMAAGGIDYYKNEWPDTLMAILEHETAEGTVRALVSIQTTTSGDGETTFEHFMGTDGSIKISENPKWTKIFREPHARPWDDFVQQGFLKIQGDSARKTAVSSEEESVRETGVVVPYELPIVLNKPICQPHLENFFDAVRGKAKLACGAEEAWPVEVVIHKVNRAVEEKKMLLFAADEFKV